MSVMGVGGRVVVVVEEGVVERISKVTHFERFFCLYLVLTFFIYLLYLFSLSNSYPFLFFLIKKNNKNIYWNFSFFYTIFSMLQNRFSNYFYTLQT